jgi:hypothetical protein
MEYPRIEIGELRKKGFTRPVSAVTSSPVFNFLIVSSYTASGFKGFPGGVWNL